jgi:hypothetical protein
MSHVIHISIPSLRKVSRSPNGALILGVLVNVEGVDGQSGREQTLFGPEKPWQT